MKREVLFFCSVLTFIVILQPIFTMSSNYETNKSMNSSTYLALGDSYTIGEGVSERDTWPYQLINRLNKNDFSFQLPKIIAKTGWRTDQLIKAVEEENLSVKFDLVSLLIGVNNQFQGKDIDQFKTDFRTLLNTSIGLCSKGKSRVFVLSIPDYGATPFGKLERDAIKTEIDEWNAVCKKICDEFEVLFIDVTSISRLAISQTDLICKDRLHPSAKMYLLWVDELMNHLPKFLK